jgi:hypothetical protein
MNSDSMNSLEATKLRCEITPSETWFLVVPMEAWANKTQKQIPLPPWL